MTSLSLSGVIVFEGQARTSRNKTGFDLMNRTVGTHAGNTASASHPNPSLAFTTIPATGRSSFGPVLGPASSLKDMSETELTLTSSMFIGALGIRASSNSISTLRRAISRPVTNEEVR